VGFEPTIPVFDQAKTFHALDLVATVIGTGNMVMVITNRFINSGYSGFMIIWKDYTGTDRANWLFLHVLVLIVIVIAPSFLQ
jgi:hypothetical protein